MQKIISFIFICTCISSFAQNATDVPGWFTNIPKSNNKKIYAIGISDPKMEEADAYKLAILRAKAMLALFRKSTVQQVVDLYESQKEEGNIQNSQKLEKLSKIFSTYAVDSAQIEIVEKEYNKDMEALVLIREVVPKLDTAKFKDTVKVECNSFMQEFKIDEASKSVTNYIQGALEIKGKTRDSLKCYFECVDENNVDFSVVTTFMDSVYCTHSTMHEYKNSTDKEINPSDYFGYSHTKKGLWKAYLDAVLQNMIALSDIMKFKTKNAADNYGNETNKDFEAKDENLTRNISCNTLSVALKEIAINQNKLWLKMAAVSYEKTEFKKKTEKTCLPVGKVITNLKKPLDKLKGSE
ncbi:MAG: hypothetical protein HY958_03860 [Bacteroidia bacterium]|nr:hypothetical protein [Bacteroidia bacterium]